MSRLKMGKAAACLILAFLAVMLFLGGCSSSKYQAVNLDSSEPAGGGSRTASSSEDSESGGESEEAVPGETMVSFTLGQGPGDGNKEEAGDVQTEAGEGQNPGEGEGSGETEPADPYEEADEVVVVTADMLNVRESERQGARIYAQLKQGSTLRRTGYSDEWSRVLYDGKTAYVSSAMVAVQEPETEASSEETKAGEGTGIGKEAGKGVPAAAGAEAAMADMGARAAADPEAPFNGRTVAIDAGHQAKANAEKEPIGPGADTMKAKMPEGSVGVSSGAKECELTLSVARKLEKELKARGYHVVMVRESNDVNLSNAERASIANKSGAEIFIRLHANSMENSSVYGALAMCMTAQNPYNAGLHDKSYTLSKKIIDNICAQTGTKNRGVQEVDNSGVINWSEIPVAVVEMGFMSNPDEDRWMQDEGYQDKLVAGILTAVDSYYAEGN